MKTLFFSIKNIFSTHFIFIISSLIFWSGARFIYLHFLYTERVDAVDQSYFIFFQGIRFDIITLGFLTSIPILASIILAPSRLLLNLRRRVLSTYYLITFSLIIFIELSTPSFIEQFDIRPNILYVEYLKYPKEVISTLVKGYLMDLICAVIVIPSTIYLLSKLFNRQTEKKATQVWISFALLPFVFVLCVMSIRSTLGHRPINPSNVAISNDLMVNSLALNSLYSVMYAIYTTSKDENDRFSYGSMPREKMFEIIRQEMYLPNDAFTSSEIPTLHKQVALSHPSQPKNLVIILEESLGAEFVGSLGGLPLTPNLDRLSTQGLWFDHLYATGTRSVRGIEAVITGFLPTPAQSVVKLQKSQSGFFSIAELLGDIGYHTSFIYGGEAHFDNMRSFFVGNGFSTIIEEKDFIDPKFTGSWGVSDEDLLNKAHEQFSNHKSSPFFSLVFSTSNHTPFEFPDNSIELYDQEKATVNNAVKYADHALGLFFEKARKSDYWENTIFLVVADHNSRVYGSDLVPIERFHIPALILGGGIQPQTYSKVASQIDLIPTLLSLMGVDSTHPATGIDLMRTDLKNYQGRAIMQYNDTQAYLEGNAVVVLQREKAPEQYTYNNNALSPSTTSKPELIQKALANALFGPIAYHEKLYRLPKAPLIAQ